jgi:hypothetical protein
MNTAIEIHDSTLSEIKHENLDIILHLDKAYIHRSVGIPGIDTGTGWLQTIDIKLCNAVIKDTPSAFPTDLDNGYFQIDGKKYENCIKLPLNASGEIEVVLFTKSGEKLSVRAKHARVIKKGEASYLETFPGTTT